MNGWYLVAPEKLENKTVDDKYDNQVDVKVMLTKSLVTFGDFQKYIAGDPEGVVLGSYGLGIISETVENLFDLKVGSRVYVNPNRNCEKCYHCNNGEPLKCSDIQIAGEDFNGFLRNFVTAKANDLFYLPDSVSDEDALFIEYISLSLNIIDKLNIQKGEHIAVLGASNLGIILSQLLIYYQAIPILMDTDDSKIETAKLSGIYYTLGKELNWHKEVSQITGGRLVKGVIYIGDCGGTGRPILTLAGFNAPVAITGYFEKNAPLNLSTAMKKQLVIHCINSGYGYTASSINLLANKAVNLKYLKLDREDFSKMDEKFRSAAEYIKDGKDVNDVIVSYEQNSL